MMDKNPGNVAPHIPYVYVREQDTPLPNMFNPAPSQYISSAQYNSQSSQEDTYLTNDTLDDHHAKVSIEFHK